MNIPRETIISDLVVGSTLLLIGGVFGWVTLISDINAQVEQNTQEMKRRGQAVDQVPVIIERLENTADDVHDLQDKVNEIRQLNTEILIELRAQRRGNES